MLPVPIFVRPVDCLLVPHTLLLLFLPVPLFFLTPPVFLRSVHFRPLLRLLPLRFLLTQLKKKQSRFLLHLTRHDCHEVTPGILCNTPGPMYLRPAVTLLVMDRRRIFLIVNLRLLLFLIFKPNLRILLIGFLKMRTIFFVRPCIFLKRRLPIPISCRAIQIGERPIIALRPAPRFGMLKRIRVLSLSFVCAKVAPIL